MPAIAFVSSKGGVGKSTSAALLAIGLVGRGLTVALVDADPNLPLTAWTEFGWRTDALPIFSAPKFQDLPAVLRQAKRTAPWVVVDTEGGAPAMSGSAVANADLVITPLSASWLEAREALKTAGVVSEACRRERRPIPVVALFSRIPVGRRRSIKEAVSLLDANGLPVLEAILNDREIFRRLFSAPSVPVDLSEGGASKHQTAREQVQAFSQEVIGFF